MTLRFVTLTLTVQILLVATCAPVHLDILEMEPCVLVREMLFCSYNVASMYIIIMYIYTHFTCSVCFVLIYMKIHVYSTLVTFSHGGRDERKPDPIYHT